MYMCVYVCMWCMYMCDKCVIFWVSGCGQCVCLREFRCVNMSMCHCVTVIECAFVCEFCVYYRLHVSVSMCVNARLRTCVSMRICVCLCAYVYV